MQTQSRTPGEGLNGSGKRAAKAKAGAAVPAERGPNKSAESFAQIVGLLMRDRHFRGVTLGDLEGLLVPAIVANQYAVAHAPMPIPTAVETKPAASPEPARIVPVAAALWARVSDSIDKALSDNPAGHPKLRAADWTSGEHIWIMTLAGNPKSFPRFMDQLVERDFKGKPVKMRVRAADGQVSVKVLGAAKAG